MNAPDHENPPVNALTPKQMKVIPYLVAYPSISEAAEKSGCSRNTLYEWMKIPAFREELERQRLVSYDEVLARFSSLGDKAIGTYAQMLGTYNERRAAASDIIRHLVKAGAQSAISKRLNEVARRQEEILKRLEKIENALPEKRQPKPPKDRLD